MATRDVIGPTRSRRTLLCLLVVGSVLFQLALLLPNVDMPPRNDERQYLGMADGIQSGQGLLFLGFETSLRPPVYPYFVALATVGENWPPRLGVGLLQIAVSALSMTLLYLLTAALFDQRAALVAAGIFGFYPTIAAHTHLLWSESFMLCPTIAALLMTERSRSLDSNPLVALGAGAIFGLGALTREYLFWFIPVASLWLTICPATTAIPVRKRILAGVLVLAGALVVVLPWTARNYRVHGEAVLIATNSWSPLFLANNDGIPGIKRHNAMIAFYLRYLGREIERERFSRNEALRFVRDQMPMWVVERVRIGLPALLSLQDFPLRQLRVGWYGEVSKLVRTAAVAAVVISYVALLIAFSFGLMATRLTAPRALVLLFMLYAAIIVLPFPVTSRYRLPLEALAMPFAAAWLTGYEASAARLQTRTRRLVAALIATCLVGTAIAGGWWAVEKILLDA